MFNNLLSVLAGFARAFVLVLGWATLAWLSVVANVVFLVVWSGVSLAVDIWRSLLRPVAVGVFRAVRR